MQKTLLSYLMVATILLSLLMFLMAPHQQFIPKTILFLIALGLAVWQMMLRRIGSAVIFLLAAISISMTLFHRTWVKDLDIAFIVIWALAVIVIQKRRNESDL